MNIFEVANGLLKNNQHLADWSQFVGGVLTIGAAAAIASEGHRENRRQDERRALAILSAALAATSETANDRR